MAAQNNQKELVSAIIPAYNEGQHIHEVLEVACTHPEIGEVIVVDDGSQDNTSIVARRYSNKVITLQANNGKAYALDVGVGAARYNIVLFLDADLINLTHKKISTIIRPVIEHKYTMYAGLRDKKIYWINRFVGISPIITGERAFRKELWYSIPEHYKDKFQIEIALNFYAKKTPKGMGFELLKNHGHRTKTIKHGFFRGMYGWVGMIKDLVVVGAKVYIGENIKILVRKNKWGRSLTR